MHVDVVIVIHMANKATTTSHFLKEKKPMHAIVIDVYINITLSLFYWIKCNCFICLCFPQSKQNHILSTTSCLHSLITCFFNYFITNFLVGAHHIYIIHIYIYIISMRIFIKLNVIYTLLNFDVLPCGNI